MTCAENAPAPHSVCLLRLSALGDVVLTLPLLRAIQRGLPDAKLTWIIGRVAYPLVESLETEGVELVVLDKPRNPGDYLAFRRRLSGRRFDVVLCLQASARTNLLLPHIHADRKIGYRGTRARDLQRGFVREGIEPRRNHIADGFLQFGEMIGVAAPAVSEWRLPIEGAASDWAARALPSVPFVAINPCASKPERTWRRERYAAVARELYRRHRLPAVLVGGDGPLERRMGADLAADLGAAAIDLVGRTSLPQLAATLARARFLLAPDTGPAHLANAVGTPVVGLYASARCALTGPYRRTDFCVDRYEEAVRRFLHREPTEDDWHLRVHDPKAMDLIAVEDVLDRCEAALSAGGEGLVTG